MHSGRRHARWPWLIILALALVEPATHLWLAYGISGERAHSGLHIGESPFFLTEMRLFSEGFQSPYLPCADTDDPKDPWLFALPHHGIYGMLGWIAALLHLDPFLLLGFANGLGGAFYLWMALRFFRVVIPDRAHFAFTLFCLGGGLGGLIWLATLPFGIHAQPAFEAWFHRFARYELIEGPYLSPALVLPRLYYTLPLGLGFAALVQFITSAGREKPIPGKRAMALQFLCTGLNAPVGLLFWGVAVSFLIGQPVPRPHWKWRYGLYFLFPTAAAAMLVYIPFGMNTYGASNLAALPPRPAWIGALLMAAFWAWPAVAVALWRHTGQLRGFGRLLAGWAIGYGCTYLVLYAAYQVWHGNVFAGGDTDAASAVSGWALIGLVPGTLTYRRRRSVDPAEESETWIALWFAGLGCFSVAAIAGGGGLPGLLPEQGLVLLGPPLAILAAEGIAILRGRYPRAALACTGMILAGGLASLGVGALCFQGPLGHTPNQSPFGWVHSEVVLAEDRALLDRLEHGTVLAPASLPPLLGDVAVAQHPGLKTVFGQPTRAFGDTDMLGAAREVQRFFAPGATEMYRFLFIQDWCVDYVFCPATRPVDPGVVAALDALPWLERIAMAGDAVLFRVASSKGPAPLT